MSSPWITSRIETEGWSHNLDHSAGEIPEEIQSRGAVQEGSEAIAVYQIPESVEVVNWDLSELDQEIGTEER